MSRTIVLLSLALAACQGAPEAPVARHVQTAPAAPTLTAAEAVPDEEIVVTPPEIAAAPVEPAPFAAYTLRRGETLAHFARWSGVPVEEIAELSGLDLGGDYPVGTEIRVPVQGEVAGLVEERREQHRERRVEGYLGSRGGSIGTEFVQVRTGDTAWNIAHDAQGIPVWMLEAYNPSVDLDRLRPGQELMVPVLADVVVDAEVGPESALSAE